MCRLFTLFDMRKRIDAAVRDMHGSGGGGGGSAEAN
jgi:hypothetical protein